MANEFLVIMSLFLLNKCKSLNFYICSISGIISISCIGIYLTMSILHVDVVKKHPPGCNKCLHDSNKYFLKKRIHITGFNELNRWERSAYVLSGYKWKSD
jgi:hypothetical protein